MLISTTTAATDVSLKRLHYTHSVKTLWRGPFHFLRVFIGTIKYITCFVRWCNRTVYRLQTHTSRWKVVDVFPLSKCDRCMLKNVVLSIAINRKILWKELRRVIYTLFARTHTHTHIYIYIYTHTHIYIYTHTHTHQEVALSPYPDLLPNVVGRNR